MTRVIESPTRFVVEDYDPDLCIDFRKPAAATDLDEVRESADVEAWRELPLPDLLREADRLCLAAGVSEEEGDFIQGVQALCPGADLERALAVAAAEIADVDAGATPFEQVQALLSATGVLSRPPHFPVTVACHRPRGRTVLEGDATHFGYVLEGGNAELHLADGRRFPLYERSYFCVPGAATLEGDARIEVVTRHRFLGLLAIGGRVEPWGRLEYIDGCTDTCIVQPPRFGDPCFNALYFPPRTEQTLHVHPSLRAGVVVAGEGVCKTPTGDHALWPGRIFFLPPETWHAFHTGPGDEGKAALTVVAFHPDSDFGPSDTDHPMLNRTYFRYLHRLRSAQRHS